MEKINKDIISFLMKANLPAESKVGKEQVQKRETLKTSRTDNHGNTNSQRKQKQIVPIRVEAKTGRNEPCPCGSGKKYKQCHGK
jgi:preprotein translocase subunit SecA